MYLVQSGDEKSENELNVIVMDFFCLFYFVPIEPFFKSLLTFLAISDWVISHLILSIMMYHCHYPKY